MAAPVRLECEFFDDPSIDALATILGYEDRDTAAGKLARLFSWQTEKYTAERPTYAVPRSTLIGIFGARGPEAMVEAGLATLQADGLYKIHGSDKPNGRTPGKTRVNWLWLERQAQAERGRKRAASAGDGARDQGRFTSAAPAGDQPATSRKHAGDQPPASSLISDLSSQISDLSLSGGARDLGAPEPSKPAPAPSPVSPDRQLGELAEHAITRLTEARRRVDPNAPPIPVIVDQPGRQLMDHLRPISSEMRRSTLDRAIDVMVATFGAESRPVGDYRMAMLAGPNAWSRWRDGTVAGAGARPEVRAGPRVLTSSKPLRGVAAALAQVAELEAEERNR